MGHAILAAALIWSAAADELIAERDDSVRIADVAATASPRLLTDVLVVGTTTGVWSLLNPGVRSGILEHGSVRHIADNFRRPIRRAIEGAREDNDLVTTNYVAHPVSWGMLALYLKERGYSNASALAFTQAHSVLWEYVIEGAYMKPSGKDLIANVVGTTLALYVVHGVSEGAAGRRDRSLHHHLLAWLNPFRPFRHRLAPGSAVPERAERGPALGIAPVRLADALGIGVNVTW
jgi:hypothetical protein